MNKKEYDKQYRLENKAKEQKRYQEWYAKQDSKELYQKRKARQLELGHNNYYNSPERCYKMYQRNAKKGKRLFLITLNEFTTFWQSPCFYCGESIETIGVDRINNQVGYILDNLVACCTIRNLMKRSLDQNIFLNKCKQIIKNQTS
jgi:hypothetical protein